MEPQPTAYILLVARPHTDVREENCLRWNIEQAGYNLHQLMFVRTACLSQHMNAHVVEFWTGNAMSFKQVNEASFVAYNPDETTYIVQAGKVID